MAPGHELHERNLAAVLRMVAERLDGAGLSWAVCAGAAAAIYGSGRPLTDVDVLVADADGERVAALFPEGETIRQAGSARGVRLPDCDLVAGLTVVDLDAEMAARLTRHNLLGVGVPVISVEDNVLLKGLWGRGADQGKHDWEDVEAMMVANAEVDWAYLEWRAASMASAEAEAVLGRLKGMWMPPS